MSRGNQTADFFLGGKPFMLQRGQFRGRAWTRSGRPDTAGRQDPNAVRYGEQPPEISHTEVWDDWSGGFGDAYRHPDRPNGYHWAENFDGRFPRQLVHCQALRNMAASTVMTNGFLDTPHLGQEKEHARLGAGSVVRWGTKHWEQEQPYDTGLIGGAANVEGVSFGQRSAIFGSFIYAPVVEGTQFIRVNFAGAVVNSDSHGLPAQHFAVSGNRLWRTHGPITSASRGRAIYLQSCAAGADPTVTGNWSATLTLGDGLVDATDLAALDDQVFVGGQDGLYAGDSSGTFYNVLAELRNQRHADNCRDLAIHNGAVMVPHIGGVYRYEPSSTEARAREVGPAYRSNRGPARGHVRALRAYGPWLLGGLWTGSASWLLAASDASPGLPYVWHTMQRLPVVAKVSRLHVDSITVSSGGLRPLPPRVWVATDASIEISGTAPIYYYEIPRGYGNSLNPDPTFSPNYVGSARMDFGAVNADAPGTPKTYRTVEVWADRLASGALWCDVYYTVDSGARIKLDTAVSSPRSVLNFPAGAGSFVTGQSVVLSLESFTATAGLSPVYRAVILRSTLAPSSVDVVEAVTRIADGMKDRRDAPMRPGAVMLAELRAFAAGPPQQLVDLSGATSWVKVLAPVQEQETYQQGEDNPEVAATVRMAVLDFSAG